MSNDTTYIQRRPTLGKFESSPFNEYKIDDIDEEQEDAEEGRCSAAKKRLSSEIDDNRTEIMALRSDARGTGASPFLKFDFLNL
jgi:hypothetical protein